MKYCLMTLAIFLSSLGVKAQTGNWPNARVVVDIEWLATQIGSQVPDAEMRVKRGYLKMATPDATHEQYASVAKKILIIFEKEYNGKVNLVECRMFNEELPTIKLAIELMHLIPSGEADADGGTNYVGPYRGYLRTDVKATSLVIRAKAVLDDE